MKNKTCGECRHFRCEDFKKMCLWRDSHREACADFDPPTNGDKIRQMSNEEIAAFVCVVLNDRSEETFRSVLDFINAPAESDGK